MLTDVCRGSLPHWISLVWATRCTIFHWTRASGRLCDLTWPVTTWLKQSDLLLQMCELTNDDVVDFLKAISVSHVISIEWNSYPLDRCVHHPNCQWTDRQATWDFKDRKCLNDLYCIVHTFAYEKQCCFSIKKMWGYKQNRKRIWHFTS